MASHRQVCQANTYISLDIEIIYMDNTAAQKDYSYAFYIVIDIDGAYDNENVFLELRWCPDVVLLMLSLLECFETRVTLPWS